MTNRFVIAAITTATAATALLVAPAADAAPAHPPIRVVGDCLHATYEPQQIVIACGDDGIFFKHLHYTSWTAAKATGTGVLWVNTDDPTAAAGNYVHHRVKVVLDQPKHVDRQLRYSRIVARGTNKHGKHFTRVEYPPIRKAR